MSGGGDAGDDADVVACGRTAGSWFKIITWYIFYYTFLMGYWYGWFTLFTTTISAEKPYYVHGQGLGLIGTNPGIVLRPQQRATHMESTLYRLNWEYDGIHVGWDQEEFNSGYAARMKAFLDVNRYVGEMDSNAVNCSDAKSIKESKKANKWCHFDVSQIGPCAEYPHGFGHTNISFFNDKLNLTEYLPRKVAPCFAIKVNRILDLDIPPLKSSKNVKKEWPKEIKKKMKEDGYNSSVYIHCEGEFPEDKALLQPFNISYLGGNHTHHTKQHPSMEFFPKSQAIDSKYFPVTTKNNRENPMVAVRLNNLFPGKMYNIKCQSYYKGVDETDKSKSEKPNILRFQVFVRSPEDTYLSG